MKLVFELLVKIFIDIMTYFLKIIILNLAKVLLLFGLLILFFGFDSIDTSDESFTISATYLRTLTVIFVFFLNFIRRVIT